MKPYQIQFSLMLFFAFVLTAWAPAWSEDISIPLFTSGAPFVLQKCAAADESAGALQLGKPGKYHLEVVISGSGRGRIGIEPITAECSRSYAESDTLCTYGFDPGTVVLLKAEATGLTDRFNGWIGNCEPLKPGEENVCRVVMNEDRKRVTAVFSRPSAAIFPLPWS